MEIQDRITALRGFMSQNGISAFIVPSTDPHSGEYVPAHWESRKWLSGFSGSAGTVVVTKDNAGLWTDSRYFIQAEEQLAGTGIQLFKDRLPETPSVSEWLGSVLNEGEKVGIDGWVNSMQEAAGLRKELQTYGLELTLVEDPFQYIWNDRPSLPQTPVFIHGLEYAGVSCSEKISKIKEAIKSNGATSIILSSLDEIAWTLNLRGDDVHCNPLFISYLILSDKKNTLYILEEKITEEVRSYLKEQGVEIEDYKSFSKNLKAFSGKDEELLQISPQANEALYALASQHTNVTIAPSPVALMKAHKNPIEIAGFRKAMERDGVAMVKFLRWLKDAVKTGEESELSVDEKLYELRAEQANFKGISFDTIAGYKEHAAIVHYEATP